VSKKPTKQGPEATRFTPGQSGNPGGLTKEERSARDVLRKALSEPATLKLGLDAYKQLLLDCNPIIVKDFMDRVAGKPTQPVEHSATESLEALILESFKGPAT
jgi:hypothetical protein